MQHIKMSPYLVQPTVRIFVKGYGFFLLKISVKTLVKT